MAASRPVGATSPGTWPGLMPHQRDRQAAESSAQPVAQLPDSPLGTELARLIQKADSEMAIADPGQGARLSLLSARLDAIDKSITGLRDLGRRGTRSCGCAWRMQGRHGRDSGHSGRRSGARWSQHVSRVTVLSVSKRGRVPRPGRAAISPVTDIIHFPEYETSLLRCVTQRRFKKPQTASGGLVNHRRF